MEKLIGIIPAAGLGTRARPYTSLVPKGMLLVGGRPNLERIVCLMRDSMAIEDIYIVVGYLGQVVKDYFQDGGHFGVRIHYVENDELDRGLAWSILLAGRKINASCCVMLSDECYVGSNHNELLKAPWQQSLATCTVMNVDDVRLIKRNYSVKMRDGKISHLVEKPEKPENNLLGCGTFLLNPSAFDLLAEEFTQSSDGYVEFVTFLDRLCALEGGVSCFQLSGTYVNINDRDSLNLARYYERNRSFMARKISVALYSEGGEQNIVRTIRKYLSNRAITALYVILPHENSIEAEISKTAAKVIKCPAHLSHYGEKFKFGLERVNGDIIVMAEAAYTFPEQDVYKLLSYLKEADMVAGTRTTRQLIGQDSDMCGLVRLANVLLAKILEVLWWTYEPRFTDVGCTFRAFWRSNYEEIKDNLNAKGPEFLTEMVIEILESRGRIIEIPVNYSNRYRAMHVRYRNYRTFFSIFSTMLVKRFLRRSAKKTYAKKRVTFKKV